MFYGQPYLGLPCFFNVILSQDSEKHLRESIFEIMNNKEFIIFHDQDTLSDYAPFFAQIINYGVILHKGAYFRDEWNFIDALVVSCAIASLVLR